MFGWFRGKSRKIPPTAESIAAELQKLSVPEAADLARRLEKRWAGEPTTPDEYREIARQLTERFPEYTPQQFFATNTAMKHIAMRTATA